MTVINNIEVLDSPITLDKAKFKLYWVVDFTSYIGVDKHLLSTDIESHRNLFERGFVFET